MRRLARIVATAVLSTALLAGASACGGDDDKPADGDQEATEFGDLKPEDVRASPAEVSAGFRELNRYIDDLLTKMGSDEPAAAELQERLLTIWESILGTVKANDDAAFSELDTAISLLMTVRGTDDKPRAEEAAETVEEVSASYLERFPGSGTPEASASPAASDDPDSGSESGSDTGSGSESDVESDADPPISY